MLFCDLFLEATAVELKVLEDTPKLIRVALSGELDMIAVHQVGLKFSALMAGDGKNAIVDMSGVPIIVSLGIGMLISAYKVLKRKGAKLVLLNPQPAVVMVLETSGLCEMLGVATDEAAAQSLLSIA